MSASSLDIMVYTFFDVPDWRAELAEKKKLFLDFMKTAQRVGVGFAFPTQTIEIEQVPSINTILISAEYCLPLIIIHRNSGSFICPAGAPDCNFVLRKRSYVPLEEKMNAQWLQSIALSFDSYSMFMFRSACSTDTSKSDEHFSLPQPTQCMESLPKRYDL